MDKLEPIDFVSYPVLPYWTKVREPLFDIIATIKNRTDRDLREELEARAKGARIWLLTHVRVAEQIHLLVEQVHGLVKEKAVKLEVSVTLPPLVRVLFDSVCSIMFVFENPTERLPWFWKSTWREIVEDIKELKADYGNDPLWTSWIARLENERDQWRTLLDTQGTPLSAAELADETQVRYWPNPGKMAEKTRDAERKKRLRYLSLKYYGDLSGASHLSGTGLLSQGGVFLKSSTDDANRKYLSDQILKGVTGLFSLVSECAIDAIRDPALARRVVSLWKTENLWLSGLETYQRCFEERLTQLSAQ